KARGAKVIVLDTRLSNTATHADIWISPQPGSEAAILLAIARHLLENRLYDREFVRRWWNWQEFIANSDPEAEPSFETFERMLGEIYAEYTFEFAARESGVDAGSIADIAGHVATAGTRLATHNW